MTRLSAWRLHSACRKEAMALKKRLARAERRLLDLRKRARKVKP